MQRSTSYRKPAPVYIPSPPPSPQVTSMPPSIRIDAEEVDEEAQEEEIPPLPLNWREIVSAIIVESQSIQKPPESRETCDVEQVHITEPLSSEKLPIVSKELPELPKEHGPTLEEDRESLTGTLRTGSLYLYTHTTQRVRGLPTQYRPPTPPLRSQTKRSKRIHVPADKTSEAIYSEAHPPQHQGIQLVNNTIHHYIDYPRAGAGGSLKATASFRTEKTMVSMNTNHSRGWPNGLGASSDRGMYSVPTLLMQKQAADMLVIESDASEGSGTVFCCCSGLAVWAKKLRNFMISR